MKIMVRILLVLSLSASNSLWAGEALHPVKMSGTQIAGALLESDSAVVKTRDGVTTWDAETYLSDDKDFDMGLWRTEAFRKTYDQPWPYNEYVHITEGSLKMISSDGEVTELEAGDSAVVPMGWTGTWDTPGLTKIYVIHAPNKDL
jgi:uncharacterized cupin superfamily protein